MKKIVLASILGSLIVPAFAQTPPTRPAFEVASIKLSLLNEGSDSNATPGRLRMQGTLKSLIRIAYGLTNDQIEGGPNWLDQDHYEIDAKAEGPADTPELFLMLQTLLADRFQLQFHRESKSVSGYALVIGKNGLKMKEAAPGTSHTTRGGMGNLTGENVSMSRLSTRLANVLGAPVVDETGNSGSFDFKLTWAPEKNSSSPGVSASEADKLGPSIFTAIQEQLGLRLEPQKVPFELLVVDRAARPSLN